MAFYDGEIISKPIISDAVPISDKVNAYLYLIYYPNNGYGVVYEQGEQTILRCVRTSIEVEDLEKLCERVDNSTSELKTDADILKCIKEIGAKDNYHILYSIIKSYEAIAIKSLKAKEPNLENIEAIREIGNLADYIDLMVGNIADKLFEKSFKFKQVPSNLKKYLDADAFKYYVKLDDDVELIDDKDAIDEAKKNIYNKINDLTEDIIAFMNKYDVKQRPTFEADLLNLISKGNFPHFELRQGGSKNAKLKFAEELEHEFNIKVINLNGGLEPYYLHEKGYYTKLSVGTLQQEVKKLYGYTLKKTDIKGAFEDIANYTPLLDNCINFKNGVYDISNNEFIKRKDKTDNIANLENNFILMNIGVKQDDKTIDLLDFDVDMYLTDIKRVIDPNDFEVVNITLVEKTLRQILIPKDNPSDLTLYIDFLERLGSCIESKNQFKVASLYYGLGDDGKSILNYLIRLLFNNRYKQITSATLQDNFKAQDFLNKSVLAIDEITENDLNSSEFINELKKMTSNTGSSTERAMYTSDMVEVDQYPPLFIFANNLPTINLSEISLLSRYDVMIMPNRFVEPSELTTTHNSYLKNRNLPSELKQDVLGLSWLISASIRCYEDLKEDKRHFINHQHTTETYRILTGNDIVTEFIMLYCELAEDTMLHSEYTTNKDIVEQIKTYAEAKGERIKENTIAKDVGNTLKRIFGEANIDKQTQPVRYKVKIKSIDDIIKENKHIYLINEDLTDAELKQLSYLGSNEKLVYDNIKDGNNTINILQNKYSKLNARQTIKELLSKNLIIKTNETNITEK